jgi:hypothetical protein
MICNMCSKNVKQLIGENRKGKFVQGCWDCLFPKKSLKIKK